MFKLHSNAKHLVKRVALLSCVTAICALGAGGTAMAWTPDTTTPPAIDPVIVKIHSPTEAHVSWTASDPDGIDRYRLTDMQVRSYNPCPDGYLQGPTCGVRYEYRTVSISLSSPTATEKVVSVADGQSHTFRVEAWDRLGNRSSREALGIKHRLIQHTDLRPNDLSLRPLIERSAGWTGQSSSDYSGGSTLRSNVAGSTARYSWSSDAVNVALIGTRGPEMGNTLVKYTYNKQSPPYTTPATVNESLVEVAQNALSARYQRVLSAKRYTHPTPGSIQVTAGVNADLVMSGRGYSDVDAIVLFEYSPAIT